MGRPSGRLSLLALATLLLAGLQRPLGHAKPVSQNQVRFRRLPPAEFSAALGASITIECEAGASPPPSIHWLKNGVRIPQAHLKLDRESQDAQQAQLGPVDDVNRIALSSTRSRLFIDCAQPGDEAQYTCVAENPFSRVSSHTRLHLLHQGAPSGPAPATGADSNELLDEEEPSSAARQPAALPQCLRERFTALEPARIHMWTHNIVEVMKNDVILRCRSNAVKLAGQTDLLLSSTGNKLTGDEEQSQLQQQQQQQQQPQQQQPSAQLSWTLPNDRQVGPELSDKYQVLSSGDLLIKDLRWQDMGSYVCTVSDEQSSDSISAFVYPASVKAAPAAPTNNGGSPTNKRALELQHHQQQQQQSNQNRNRHQHGKLRTWTKLASREPN